MGIVANNRRDHARAKEEQARHIRLTTCKCGKRMTDHLEHLSGKCMDCMCKRWDGIAEDALL